MNAEEKFLDQLLILHASFPTLKIVLEHVSTAAAVEAVLRMHCTFEGHILGGTRLLKRR